MAPDILRKPFAKLKGLKDSSGLSKPLYTNGDKADGTMAPNGAPEEHVAKGNAEERCKRSESRKRKNAQNENRDAPSKRIDPKFLEVGEDVGVDLYKPLSMNMSKRREHEERILFKNLDVTTMDGNKTISFRARIHTIRRLSARLAFVVFRQQTITIQGVLQMEPDNEKEAGAGSNNVSEKMVRSVERYPIESIVLVKAKLRRPPQEVKNATIHNVEFEILEMHLISILTEHVPFTVYEAENSNRFEEEDNSETETDGFKDNKEKQTSISPTGHMISLPQRVRLNNRIVDLRTAASQSIFRIQSGVCNIFRSYLDSRGFIEIHTPKLQGGATESGATVFEVEYFGRPAFLAQSPQLAKQMCIAADFERVYEIGPVFRAENSNTPRHMTEYTGLDLEMALEEHYHETLEIIDGMFKHLWQKLYERYATEIEIISRYYPHQKVLWLEETPRIPFSEGIQMLIDDGWTDSEGKPPSEYEDLNTRAEIRLGQLVREKYRTDYYVLDKFPTSARPFYTMPDPTNNKFTNSFDIFMRGQEILTGGQRIHDAKFLEKRMRDVGVAPETMEEYMEGFRLGAPPHAGAGIGLERLLYLFLDLGNIRLASLFPRDPRSLPERPRVARLRHPEASTTNPPWENDEIKDSDPIKRELQPLTKLIANYGDAANTSWLDDRYEVWRHESTGAAQAFVQSNRFAIIVGEPLCAKSQYPQVVSAFIHYLKTERKSLKPIWLLVGPSIEEYLGEKFGWRTLSVAAEERADPRDNPAWKDNDVARKIRHAKKEGIKNIDVPFNEPVAQDLKERINTRIQDWQRGRKGKQVHITEIRPWIDQEHRRYFYAADGDKGDRIHALIVLHQLAPENGYQVKFSLEFPDAPSGTIESLTLHAMSTIVSQDPDVKSVTFGTGAMEEIIGGRNIGKRRLSALKKIYAAINQSLKLTNKSDFRAKLGAKNERVFVAYPKGGLGMMGIKAILGFLGTEEGQGADSA